MATGIPETNGRKSNGMDFRIEYEGKRSTAEILGMSTPELFRTIDLPGEAKNRIIYGDNLQALRALIGDKDVHGRVRLTYIDPPYATRSKFSSRQQSHAYDDILSGAEYLEFLRERIILIRELLAEDGSIYVHLDDKMAYPVKVIMDEVFGSKYFRNWITRKKCNPKNYTRKQFGNVADYILFYTKSDRYIWNQVFEQGDTREYRYVDERTGRRYMKVPIHAPGQRNGATGQPWKGMLPPPGKHWQYPPVTLEEMDARGEIYWSANGNPRRKVFLETRKGIPVQDIWMDFKDAHNQNIRVTGYPTEKNPELIRRIVRASSNPGDLVLDAFAGSGTTAVACEEEGRQWIAMDNSQLAIETMIRRLLFGSEPMGDYVLQPIARKSVQSKLFDESVRRILREGLSIEFAESTDIVNEGLVEKWRRLLATD